MELGLSSLLFEDCKLESKLSLLEKAGIKYIEVKPKEGHFDFQDPKYLDKMAKEFKKYGIKVKSMHMPTNGVDISLIEEYDRVWSIREVEKTVLALLRLEGEIIEIHPGSAIEDKKMRKKRREKSEQSLEEILEFCEHWGINIALENTLPGKTGDNILEILEIVRKFNSVNLGMCLDIGHCHITSSLYGHHDLPECLQDINNSLYHLHIHDNFGKSDDHFLPFEGSVNWEGFVKSLKEIDYKGVFMFEIRNTGKTTETIQRAKDIYQNLVQ